MGNGNKVAPLVTWELDTRLVEALARHWLVTVEEKEGRVVVELFERPEQCGRKS